MPTDIKVKDAMVARVITALQTQTVKEGSQIMAKEDVGSLVICEGKKPIGIITRKDIINKVISKGLKTEEVKLKDIMATPLMTVNADADITEAATIMSKHGYERIPVIQFDTLVGIIAAREIVKVAPAAIEILRERLLIKEPPQIVEEFNSGDCQLCGNFSEELHNINDRWVCDTCKNEAAEL